MTYLSKHLANILHDEQTDSHAHARFLSLFHFTWFMRAFARSFDTVVLNF